MGQEAGACDPEREEVDVWELDCAPSMSRRVMWLLSRGGKRGSDAEAGVSMPACALPPSASPPAASASFAGRSCGGVSVVGWEA